MKVAFIYSEKEIRAMRNVLPEFTSEAVKQGLISGEEAAEILRETQAADSMAFQNHKWIVKKSGSTTITAENRDGSFTLAFETEEAETAGLFHILGSHAAGLVTVAAKLKKAGIAIMELCGAFNVFESIQREAEKLRDVLRIIHN